MGKTASGPTYFTGQREAVSNAVFGDNGIFDQFLKGKPNAGFERAQVNGLEQLKRANTANGLGASPLGTRALSDYVTKSTQAAGDNYMNQLQMFLQPQGTRSSSAGFWGGKG